VYRPNLRGNAGGVKRCDQANGVASARRFLFTGGLTPRRGTGSDRVPPVSYPVADAPGSTHGVGAVGHWRVDAAPFAKNQTHFFPANSSKVLFKIGYFRQSL